jgi:hypothetical protein
MDLKEGEAAVNRALVYDRKGGGCYFKETKTKRYAPARTALAYFMSAHQPA